MITHVNMSQRPHSQQETGWKIKRTDPIGPGAYDFCKSFDTTQKPRLIGDSENKSKRLI